MTDIEQGILERLRGGERLISFTAAGVQWTPANGEFPTASSYEFPDKDAINGLLAANQITPTRYNYLFAGVYVPLHEFVEVKQNAR